MYGIQTTKEVANIIRSKENIIDQMLELRKHYRKKGVRQYIDRLIYINNPNQDSPEARYIRYCIVKYFYGLDANEVDKPLPKLPMASYEKKYHYNADALNALLSQKEDIIEQCKLLRCYNNLKGMQEYIDAVFEKYDYDVALAGQSRDFEIYCINKYFYELDVPEVKPRPFDLRAYTDVFRKKVKEDIPSHFTNLEEIKKGDQVKLLTGPFKDMVGTVTDINLALLKLTIMINLFGQDEQIELDTNTDKVLKVEDES